MDDWNRHKRIAAIPSQYAEVWNKKLTRLSAHIAYSGAVAAMISLRTFAFFHNRTKQEQVQTALARIALRPAAVGAIADGGAEAEDDSSSDEDVPHLPDEDIAHLAGQMGAQGL